MSSRRLPNGYTGPVNDAFPIPDGESRISIYGYTPSMALAVIGIVLFAIPFAAHLYYFFKSRLNRSFQFLLFFACAMEVVGYAFRLRSSRNAFVVIDFIIQYFFIITSPVFLSTACYLAVSGAVRRCRTTEILPVKPTLLVAFFVCIDVAATVLQILGAAFIGVSESARSEGRTPFIQTDAAQNILLAGLAIQCAFFLGFLVILGWTVLRSRRIQQNHAHQSLDKEQRGHIASPENGSLAYLPKSFVVVLATSSFFLWARTLYRLAETAEGVFGYAYSNEWTFGVFEFAPVVIAVWLWLIFPLHKLLGKTAPN